MLLLVRRGGRRERTAGSVVGVDRNVSVRCKISRMKTSLKDRGENTGNKVSRFTRQGRSSESPASAMESGVDLEAHGESCTEALESRCCSPTRYIFIDVPIEDHHQTSAVVRKVFWPHNLYLQFSAHTRPIATSRHASARHLPHRAIRQSLLLSSHWNHAIEPTNSLRMRKAGLRGPSQHHEEPSLQLGGPLSMIRCTISACILSPCVGHTN